MKPEEIDKIFKERLGNTTPTPPADLWNRLQERMETEMPQAQPEKQEQKGGFTVWYRSYGMAAAVALLLAAGLVFFSLRNNQQQQAPTLAQTETTETPAPASPADVVITEPAVATEEPAPALAEVKEPAKVTTEALVRTPAEAAPAQAIAKATPAANDKKPAVKRVEPLAPAAPARTLAAATEPQKPVVTLPEAPVALAATAAEQPERIEIIIKRAIGAQQVAMQPQEEAEEVSGIEKKQQIAKNIFKQVKNLAAGERVELSELGIRTEQIALETQIGKQKFSKVINL